MKKTILALVALATIAQAEYSKRNSYDELINMQIGKAGEAVRKGDMTKACEYAMSATDLAVDIKNSETNILLKGIAELRIKTMAEFEKKLCGTKDRK